MKQEALQINQEILDEAAIITSEVLRAPWFEPLSEEAQKSVVELASAAISYHKHHTRSRMLALSSALRTAEMQRVSAAAVGVTIDVISRLDRSAVK